VFFSVPRLDQRGIMRSTEVEIEKDMGASQTGRKEEGEREGKKVRDRQRDRMKRRG